MRPAGGPDGAGHLLVGRSPVPPWAPRGAVKGVCPNPCSQCLGTCLGADLLGCLSFSEKVVPPVRTAPRAVKLSSKGSGCLAGSLTPGRLSERLQGRPLRQQPGAWRFAPLVLWTDPWIVNCVQGRVSPAAQRTPLAQPCPVDTRKANSLAVKQVGVGRGESTALDTSQLSPSTHVESRRGAWSPRNLLAWRGVVGFYGS